MLNPLLTLITSNGSGVVVGIMLGYFLKKIFKIIICCRWDSCSITILSDGKYDFD